MGLFSKVSLILLLLAQTGWAKDYYISNSGLDTNTGTVTAPWKTISKVNSTTYVTGDTVYFQRGGVWREQLLPKSGVSFNAYGEGRQPILTRAINANSGWTGSGNIWTFKTNTSTDVGNIVFNASFPAVKVKTEAELTSDLKFYSDTVNQVVKFYSATNPSTRFASIELCLNIDIIRMEGKSFITIENLELKYGGRHGINALASCSNITIRNCKLSWIGGGIHTTGFRFGNAIQFYNSHDNISVSSCVAEDIYDTAFTSQCPGVAVINNVRWENNTANRCGLYGFEGFIGANNVTGSNINGLYIVANTFKNAGIGWGAEQRWNYGYYPACIGLYNFYVDSTINFVVKYNTLYTDGQDLTPTFKPRALFKGGAYFNNTSKLDLDYNVYYRVQKDKTMIEYGKQYTQTQFAQYQLDTKKDLNSASMNPFQVPGTVEDLTVNVK